MPNTQIKWLSSALRDVTRLQEFLIDKDPAAAKKVAIRLNDGVKILYENPESGVIISNTDVEFKGYRHLILTFGKGSYTVRYRLVEPSPGQLVARIVNVWHSSEEPR